MEIASLAGGCSLAMTQNSKLEIDMLSPLSLTPSFGFGDRLGLATPGQIAAVIRTV
jgi:hypothetical protein